MKSVDYRHPDEDGRIPLSASEYEAVKAIYGAVNSFELYHKRLEKRCRSSPNLWRDIRLMRWLSMNVLERVCRTIPVKKLKQMLRELKNTYCEVRVKGASTNEEDEYVYLKRDDLFVLCKSATEMTCFGCQKSRLEAKKECPLYGIIQGLFNYEFEGNECPFSEGL